MRQIEPVTEQPTNLQVTRRDVLALGATAAATSASGCNVFNQAETEAEGSRESLGETQDVAFKRNPMTVVKEPWSYFALHPDDTYTSTLHGANDSSFHLPNGITIKGVGVGVTNLLGYVKGIDPELSTNEEKIPSGKIEWYQPDSDSLFVIVGPQFWLPDDGEDLVPPREKWSVEGSYDYEDKYPDGEPIGTAIDTKDEPDGFLFVQGRDFQLVGPYDNQNVSISVLVYEITRESLDQGPVVVLDKPGDWGGTLKWKANTMFGNIVTAM